MGLKTVFIKRDNHAMMPTSNASFREELFFVLIRCYLTTTRVIKMIQNGKNDPMKKCLSIFFLHMSIWISEDRELFHGKHTSPSYNQLLRGVRFLLLSLFIEETFRKRIETCEPSNFVNY